MFLANTQDPSTSTKYRKHQILYQLIMKTSTKTLLWIVRVSAVVAAAVIVAFSWDDISGTIKEKRFQRQLRRQTASVTFDSTRVDNIHNIILMDESGSMSSMKAEAVDGAHETVLSIIAVQDTVPELKQYLTTASFCGDNSLNLHYSVKQMPITEVNTDLSEYSPRSCTPLYDAIGTVILEYLPTVKENDRVLMTIITDGLENASRQYSAANIKELIGNLSQKNWEFTYIGTNQDAMLEGGRIGIYDSYNYDNTKEGYREMICKEGIRRNAVISRYGAEKRR